LFLFFFIWTLWILHTTYIPYFVKEGLKSKTKPLATSAIRRAEAKAKPRVALSFGLDTSSSAKTDSNIYADRIVEMQRMIEVLSNPNKTQVEQVDYLLSTETPFKLRNDPEIKQPIHNLQSCIKSYIQQIIVVNNQVRKQRPISLTKFDQKNVCKGKECERFDQADRIAKYLDDNSGDFIKQMKYILAPDFALRLDPDYTNLLATLRNGCIDTNLKKIVTFTKKVYTSWIENDSANLAIIQCKGKDMFTAECAERAKKNAIKEPTDMEMNVKSAKTKPIPRAKGTGRPPTIQANPAVRGLRTQ